MVRDDRKLVVIQGATTKPVVRIFTAAGEALAAFMWDHGRIVGMGWSNQEDLLIVEDHGEVCMARTPFLVCAQDQTTNIAQSTLQALVYSGALAGIIRKFCSLSGL